MLCRAVLCHVTSCPVLSSAATLTTTTTPTGGVYDTKYVARGLTGLGVPGATALLPDTALGPLFKPMCVSACSRQVSVVVCVLWSGWEQLV